MKQDYERALVDRDTRLDQAVDETVERIWATTPSRAKERIANEVESGAMPEIVRSTPTP